MLVPPVSHPHLPLREAPFPGIRQALIADSRAMAPEIAIRAAGRIHNSRIPGTPGREPAAEGQ